MKKTKISIIILLFIIVIVFVMILVLNSTKKDDVNVDPIIGVKESEILPEPGLIEYVTVSNCVSKYLDTINVSDFKYQYTGENAEKMSLDEIKSIAKNLLNKIDQNNVQLIKEKVIFIPIEMVKSISGRVESYNVYGIIVDTSLRYLDDLYIIVNLDIQSKAFSVEPQKNGYNSINDIKAEEIDSIRLNEYNGFSYFNLNEQNKCLQYFNNIKRLMIAKPELAYKYLNEEYKLKRFGSIEAFEEYVNKNKNIISGLSMKNFKINDDEKQIYITDQYSNVYKFEIEGTMKYKVQLDNYIIMYDEEIEKYKELSNQNKLVYNINRWIKMINSRDYEFAYNYLDKTFRENNFGSVEKFEKYIKQNWPEYINIKCSDYKEVSDVGTINVKISERGVSEEELNKVIEKTFIVKLIDDTDFKMSFNIE